MKLLAGIILTLAVLATSAAAAAEPTLVFGEGKYSCSNWLSAHSAEGAHWITGYWTGRNHDNANHTVGATTDGDGIVGEVKKVCKEHPSFTLFQATGLVYSDLSDQSR